MKGNLGERGDQVLFSSLSLYGKQKRDNIAHSVISKLLLLVASSFAWQTICVDTDKREEGEGRMFCFVCWLVASSSSSSWWSLGLEDDIICASYLWVREWLCRPILDLQSRAQSGHWKFAFVAGIQAAKWRRSLADCA